MEKKYSYLHNDLLNFNEIFRKDVPYDNIKSNKKAKPHPISRSHISGKTDSFLEPATLIKDELFLRYFSRILFNVLEDFFYRTPSLYF